jgi:hypothetical protein
MLTTIERRFVNCYREHARAIAKPYKIPDLLNDDDACWKYIVVQANYLPSWSSVAEAFGFSLLDDKDFHFATALYWEDMNHVY